MTSKSGTKQAIILLVEDDPGDQALTRRALMDGQVDVDLHIVGDGEEALDYLMRRGIHSDPATSPRPDLILLDLNLPKLDGKEVLQRVGQVPDLKRIPVVALTTSKQEEDIVKTYDLGVNSYMTKPVDMSQFIDAVRSLGNYWFSLVVLPPGE